MIASIRNPRIARAAALKRRRAREEEGRFLVEGVQSVSEALGAGSRLREVFHVLPVEARVEPVLRAAAAAGVPSVGTSASVMASLASTVTPQGPVAVADFLDRPLEDVDRTAGLVPVLVEVRDPGNAGTIIRSADAAGAGAVILTRASVDVYNPKVVRSTAGSLFHIPVVRDADLQATVAHLRAEGFRIAAASTEGESAVHDTDLTGPVAVLFGNEAHGLPAGAGSLVDLTIRVPMRGRAGSLNLAAAAAVFLFEAARQREDAAADARTAGVVGASLPALVADAAHDLRSPLTALRAFASTLRSRWDRLTPGQRDEALRAIEQDGVRSGVLVTQLAEAARLAEGSIRLEKAAVDLGALAREVARTAAGEAGSPQVVARGSSIVIADRERLRTILAALVRAAAWWGTDGPVRVEIGPVADATARISRAGGDAGSGGPALLAPSGHPGGERLGLAVARGLAEAHGGSLSAGACPGGGGVSFDLRLP